MNLALGKHFEHHGKLPAQARHSDAEVCLGVGHVQLCDAIAVHTCVGVSQIDTTQLDFAQVAQQFRGQAAFTREHVFQSLDELVISKVMNPAMRVTIACAHAAPPLSKCYIARVFRIQNLSTRTRCKFGCYHLFHTSICSGTKLSSRTRAKLAAVIFSGTQLGCASRAKLVAVAR
jgi:hypothetical protein